MGHRARALREPARVLLRGGGADSQPAEENRRPGPVTGSGGTLEVGLRGAVGELRIEAAFEARAGETTAIFGPSGSGKTTLLRAVSGLTRLSGRLALGPDTWQDDQRGVFVPAYRRRIGFAFQEPALFDHLTVEGNLRYAERRSDEPDGAPSVSFIGVVQRLGLDRHLGRMPRGLSGGERQRVSLARALLARPAVLLLDEPLSGLHRTARAAILPWLRALGEASGTVTLYVSHDLGEVVDVADRIAPIASGSVTAAAPAGQALDHLPAGHLLSRFEAGSVLTATVRAQLPALSLSELDLGGQRLRVPGTGRPVGTEARLRVRARDVAVATEAPTAISIRNVLRGTVTEVRDLPETPFAEVAVGIADQRLVARITRDAASELGLEAGREVFALLKTVSFDDA
ncbi:MAG: molybdenum ABC transporter ATP-binding protein [Acidobacteria bacterium]|nr:molybdenum ABC transporter ATP-binding protein [Acidobacteriota bacterium]MXX86109.1 molybdenum ABC transporter ATP-binding protein [Acidobacteriota bacterium]MYE42808.1 molybdenum ABC transporter ATP-binding protein [Acidobacteriota bacterium]MYG75583.1 molybdenum ABC transporter ATP-binding protein [Acidobacteriota bacterium]